MSLSNDFIYQSKAWAILSRSFQSKRTASTYLFHGAPGTGRWQLAIGLAALVNCEQPKEVEGDNQAVKPCGECRNCRNIFALSYPGLYMAVPIAPHKNQDEAIDLTNEVVQAKRGEPFAILSSSGTTNIPVSVAREIKKSLSRKPDADMTRVVLFYQMEKMKTSSADALLKMIEEPPPDTIIVLVAQKPESLLPTIQSRAQKIGVGRVPAETIKAYLLEKYEISESRATLLSRIAEGSPGRAVDLIDVADEDGTSRRSVIFFLFKSLFEDGSADLLAHMDEVLNPRDRGEADELLRLWQLLIRDCAGFAVSADEGSITNTDFAADIKRLARYFSNPRLASEMVGNIKITLADLRRNVHTQGALMALALRLKSNIRAAS